MLHVWEKKKKRVFLLLQNVNKLLLQNVLIDFQHSSLFCCRQSLGGLFYDDYLVNEFCLLMFLTVLFVWLLPHLLLFLSNWAISTNFLFFIFILLFLFVYLFIFCKKTSYVCSIQILFKPTQDNTGTQIAIVELNESNNLLWSNAVKVYLRAKGKL